MFLLRDDDIRAVVTADRAAAWMREALIAAHQGRLVAPPRTHTQLGDGRLVFTTGALESRWFGYRSYDSFPVEPGEQVVVVHDAASGCVRGIAVGNELGPRRVGGIGAVAADALSPAGARSLGLVGTGVQAWAQLWAIAAVRDLADVRVYSRDVARRTAFARRAHEELGLSVRAAPDARSAVEGADLVVLATSSRTPVIEAAWVAPAAFVTTVGPKQVGRAEFPVELVATADLAVTDSVAQISAYDPPNVLVGTPAETRLVSLGAVLAGDVGTPAAGGRVVFCSVGLAGTEVFLLDKALGVLDREERR